MIRAEYQGWADFANGVGKMGWGRRQGVEGGRGPLVDGWGDRAG